MGRGDERKVRFRKIRVGAGAATTDEPPGGADDPAPEAGPAEAAPAAPPPPAEALTKLSRKICLLGNPAVGKTSLIRSFVYETFEDEYISTIGSKVSKKEVEFYEEDSKKYYQVAMIIWDIAGQQTFKHVKQAYYRGAKGALVVCDVTRVTTLQSLEDWIKSLFEVVGPVPIVILLNKTDLIDQIKFSLADVQDLAARYRAKTMLSSAKTGKNVERAFMDLAKMMVALS
ncbi:MAG TPA: Rab family GTPase [Candidatus Thermoplasmatota archaeon]